MARKGDPVARIRAQALRELEEKHGRLVKEDVVEAAKNKKHVLHDYFEWDDTVAGHLYRLEQAAQLIREVKIEVEIEDCVVIAPFYVKDPDPNRDQASYVVLSRERQNNDNARRIIEDELDRIEAALRRARAVAAVLDLTDDLDRMVEALIRVRETVTA